MEFLKRGRSACILGIGVRHADHAALDLASSPDQRRKLAAFRTGIQRLALYSGSFVWKVDCLPLQMDLNHDHTTFFRKHYGCAGTHLPTQ